MPFLFLSYPRLVVSPCVDNIFKAVAVSGVVSPRVAVNQPGHWLQGAVKARRTPWRKFWRETLRAEQSFSWSSLAWGPLEEMIMMVINVSKETGLAWPYSAADVKSLLFNINWTGLSTISLSRQHQL